MGKGRSLAPRWGAGTMAVLALAALLAVPARAQVPDGDPTDLPFFSKPTLRGSGAITMVEGPAPVAKTVDGDISDWVGEPTRYGGTAVYSAGEYVYQDHIFDAYGADDGRDAERFETTDPVEEVFPEAYRLDALAQADLKGELGAPIPDQFAYDDSYGDAKNSAADDEDDLQDASDLEELRLAVQDDQLALLARTTTMKAPGDVALLVLADTQPDSAPATVPFDSGLSTGVADVALLIADGTVSVADLASGSVTPLEGATAVAQPAGWTNAIEATIPLAAVASADGALTLAAATGAPNATRDGFADLVLEQGDGTNPNVANVAFRLDEPVRMWFERQQALALHAGTIDDFFTSIDTAKLAAGASEQFVPGHGYHDRIFVSDADTGVPQESGENGVFQHYGVYLPAAYSGEPVPLQWWLHWRGGHAHSGASIVPKVFTQFGEDRDSIVVAPSGRGTSTWYVGKGHVDILEVWKDVFDSFAIDRSRVYVAGHSMGGWGSYLLPLVYPDRFAGAAPVAGPVTQGGWSGLDFEGCDEFSAGDETPCYIAANGSRPRDQHNRKLLDNALHVPYVILQGTNDELVWWWAVSTNAARLTELNYRHRYLTYPGYEHYSHPIADQWSEAAAYLHKFEAPPNPAHVVYKRDMLFEIATEEVQSGGATLNFDFDSAYWMSGLTPTDMEEGSALFDGRSLAIPEQPHVAVPDTMPPTSPGQTGPYAVTGIQWLPTGTPAATTNGFEATLTGASGVELDLVRMGLATDEGRVTGSIDTEAALTLRLDGGWTTDAPVALVDDEQVEATLTDGVLELPVPAGTHTVDLVWPLEVAFVEAV